MTNRFRGRRRKTAAGDQYMGLGYPFVQSPAWRSLSGGAVKVWIELRSRFNGGNNGKLSLPFEQACEMLGMSKTTVGRAFAELEEKGFIVKMRPGQWHGRQAALWAVTDRGVDGFMPANSWKNWRPPEAKKTESRYRSGTYWLEDGPA